MSSDKPRVSKNLCTTVGCGKPVVGRDFCVACYYKKLRKGDFESKSQTRRWRHRLSNIDKTTKMADCAECGRVKIYASNTRFRCSIDVNNRAKLYKRAYRQSKKNMLKDACEICGDKEKLVWDHNHTTGKFRGTLCSDCNVAIGFFKENIQNMKNAIRYLDDKSSTL